MTYPLVYVIVLHWKRLEDTAACLRSVLASDYPNYRLLVVDNGSEEGPALADLARGCPGVRVLRSERNLGFAGGNNMGLRCALAEGADYAFLANNDAIVEARTLAELVSAAEGDGRIGIAGPKIFYYQEPQRIWYLGGRRRWFWPAPLGVAEGQKDSPRYAGVGEVDLVSGCGMLIRRRVLEEVGLLDEGYFMYYEDGDLCLRAREGGYKVVYVGSARMWHKVSASTADNPPARRYMRARSKARFYRRHARGLHRGLLGPFLALGAAWATLRDGAGGNFNLIGPSLRGLWDGLRG